MRKTLRVLAGALVCASAAPLAANADDRPRFDVTPMVGYRVGGDFETIDPETTTGQKVDLDNGTSFGIDVGLYRDESSFYELLYTHQDSGFDSSDATIGGVDVSTEYLHFGGTLLFAEDTWYVPWMSLTVGATAARPERRRLRLGDEILRQPGRRHTNAHQ